MFVVMVILTTNPCHIFEILFDEGSNCHPSDLTPRRICSLLLFFPSIALLTAVSATGFSMLLMVKAIATRASG